MKLLEAEIEDKHCILFRHKSGPEGRVIMSNIFWKKTLNFDEDVCQERFGRGIMLFFDRSITFIGNALTHIPPSPRNSTKNKINVQYFV